MQQQGPRDTSWFHIVEDERPITRITRAGRLTPHLKSMSRLELVTQDAQ